MSDSKDEKEKVRRRVRLHMYKALTAGAVGSIVLGSAVSGCQSQIPDQASSRDPQSYPPIVCDPLPPPRLHMQTSVQFDFGKATLGAYNEAILDKIATQSKGLNLEVAIVIGHADRIGSKAVNKKLSEQRAATVKAYLITKGMAPNRIYTEGKGSDSPATGPDECMGPKSKKVIACLQPDRRVDIEIRGIGKE